MGSTLNMLRSCLDGSDPFSNANMVHRLQADGSLSPRLANAFLKVDRGVYVGAEESQANYADMPIKLGEVHLSAPSIYAAAVEALGVEPGHSFLHIGSGTGYFSSIVALIAGPLTVNHGVEHNAKLVKLASRLAAERGDVPNLAFFHANALQLRTADAAAESSTASVCMKYDRIYVSGVALPAQFFGLLRKGGVLVGPYEEGEPDEGHYHAAHQNLVRVVRTGPDEFTTSRLQAVHFAPLRQLAQEELRQAPALVLKPLSWSPEVHAHFPSVFRATVRLLLCMSNRKECALSLLPRDILLRVLHELPFFAFAPVPTLEGAPAHAGQVASLASSPGGAAAEWACAEQETPPTSSATASRPSWLALGKSLSSRRMLAIEPSP
mmetsp:Transcript_5505/g.14369  ORF Transcript_5505/g.14369 Transcript_5505/m.14369 type:complete len:380 (+) Transcript_5505:73-1212(+)